MRRDSAAVIGSSPPPSPVAGLYKDFGVERRRGHAIEERAAT